MLKNELCYEAFNNLVSNAGDTTKFRGASICLVVAFGKPGSGSCDILPVCLVHYESINEKEYGNFAAHQYARILWGLPIS
jgi:hypothetical protein